MLACFYRTSKFSLAWQEGRSRALLLELNTNEPDIAHKVGPYMHTCHLHVTYMSANMDRQASVGLRRVSLGRCATSSAAARVCRGEP